MSADITCPHCGKILRGAGGSVGGGAFFHAADCPGQAVAQAKEGSRPMLMNPDAATVLEQNALLRVALAASQAELAESVRALAVSQDENETTLRQHGDLCWQIEELRAALAVSQGEVELWKQSREVVDQHRIGLSARVIGAEAEAERLRGDLERARGLLAPWLSYGAAKNGEPFCGECDLRVSECDAGTFVCKGRVGRAFLAPTASPEPDRASPEAPKETNELRR